MIYRGEDFWLLQNGRVVFNFLIYESDPSIDNDGI